jgi:AcrR family transcriptional regulator
VSRLAAMSGVVRPYRGVSAEDRKAERREKLRLACLDVVGRDGVAGVTVAAVCARAGLTKRYFYESFADRDAILLDALDALFSGLRDRIQDALGQAGPGAEARARATVELLVAAMDDPRTARLYVESPGHPRLHERREQAIGAYARLVAREVLGDDLAGPREELDAHVIVAGTTHAVTSWLQGTMEITRAELIDELVRIGVVVAAR